jgi:hypothetical protein
MQMCSYIFDLLITVIIVTDDYQHHLFGASMRQLEIVINYAIPILIYTVPDTEETKDELTCIGGGLIGTFLLLMYPENISDTIF